MSDELYRLTKPSTPRRWIWLTILSAANGLVVYYRPFANLLGIEAFEMHHGVWPEIAILSGVLMVLMALKEVYLWILRRSEQRAEFASRREALLQGRVKRMSLAARCIFLLGALALVSLGWFPGGTRILAIAVPLFLLFALVELTCIIYPGETLNPDPHDELLLFFRAQMLKSGYVAAILALTALYVASLFASPYVRLLAPIALTISLLVPAFVYRRLDRQADE
jgi:hypothetical protein